MVVKTPKQDLLKGGIFAFAAFFLWGILPLYWKQFSHISTWEVLCHRVLWSSVSLTIVLALGNRFRKLFAYVAKPNHFLLVLGSTAFISTNWFIFIYSVQTNRLVEGSLGYYMNPLFFVVLGRFFLKERLTKIQTVAFFVALLGVANQTLHFGKIPWLGLSLAISFGFYGLVRKKISLDTLSVLWIETTLVSLPAGIWVLETFRKGEGAFVYQGPTMTILLLLAGVITAIPLVFFGRATKMLRLSTIGFFQFLGPSLQLALAVWVFDEPFTKVHLTTFSMIWFAVLLYCYEGIRFLNSPK